MAGHHFSLLIITCVRSLVAASGFRKAELFTAGSRDDTVSSFAKLIVHILFRNRIITAGTPRVAACDPFHSHPDTFNRTPLGDRFDRVLRARRRMTAMRTQ